MSMDRATTVPSFLRGRVYARGFGTGPKCCQPLLRKSLDLFHIWSDLMTIHWWDAIKTILKKRMVGHSTAFPIAKGRKLRLIRTMRCHYHCPHQTEPKHFRPNYQSAKRITWPIWHWFSIRCWPRDQSNLWTEYFWLRQGGLHPKCLERLTLQDLVNILAIIETLNWIGWYP